MINNPQQQSQKLEQLKYEKEQIRIQDTLSVLQLLYNNCKTEYQKFSISEFLKQKSLPYIMTAVIVKLGYLKYQGENTGRRYKWIGQEPTELIAEQILHQTRQEENAYARKKFAERKGQQSTINVGTKRFIRVIKNEPIKEIKEKEPTTLTEINMLKILKIIKTELTNGQYVMDFSALCEHKNISIHIEFALLNTVVQATEQGYIWIGGEVNYDLIRKIIDF